MPIPIWVLLIFAMWTLVTLFGSVGVYRWSRILTGRATISQWRADEVQGSDWYQRAMRAHANCVENLPVYGAVCVVIISFGVEDLTLETAAVILLFCRIGQTIVHIAFKPTNIATSVRFGLFATQAICMMVMSYFVASSLS